MSEAPAAVPSQVPSHWYNLAADLPEPCPPALHPGTREPLGPDDLTPLFPLALIMQEVVDRALGRDPRGRSGRSTGCGVRRR